MDDKEFRSGVMNDGTPVEHGGFDYVKEASRTLSHEWHGELVSADFFRNYVLHGIEAAHVLDRIKKALFYGKNDSFSMCQPMRLDLTKLPDKLAATTPLTKEQAADYIHAVLGVFTEAGEMLEQLLKAYDGQGLDVVNVIEEVGDVKWYLAIKARVFNFIWGSDERRNIAKLRKRFPEKFTQADAINRDLDGERAVLEKQAVLVGMGLVPDHLSEILAQNETIHNLADSDGTDGS